MSNNINLFDQIALDFSFIVVIFFLLKLWEIKFFSFLKKTQIKTLFICLVLVFFLSLILTASNFLAVLESFFNGFNKDLVLKNPNLDFFNFENNSAFKAYYILKVLLLAPIYEEILYRGIFQEKLIEKYKPALAIILSSLFFSLGHLDPNIYFKAFLIGLVLGYVYYKTKNLTYVIIIHFLINLVTLFFAEPNHISL